MATCRSADEAFRAGWHAAADCPPLSQDQADYVAAILASATVPEAKAA